MGFVLAVRTAVVQSLMWPQGEQRLGPGKRGRGRLISNQLTLLHVLLKAAGKEH